MEAPPGLRIKHACGKPGLLAAFQAGRRSRLLGCGHVHGRQVDNPKQAAAQIKLGRWGSNRPVLPRGSNQALLLLLRVKRGLLYLYLLYQFLDPINCTLIVDPGRQALVSLDLLVEFDAFFTHWYFPHSRVISIGCCLYDGEPALLFQRFQIRPPLTASSSTYAYKYSTPQIRDLSWTAPIRS